MVWGFKPTQNKREGTSVVLYLSYQFAQMALTFERPRVSIAAYPVQYKACAVAFRLHSANQRRNGGASYHSPRFPRLAVAVDACGGLPANELETWVKSLPYFGIGDGTLFRSRALAKVWHFGQLEQPGRLWVGVRPKS